MKKAYFFFLVVIITGCATITQGMRDEVMFTSDQDSVEVWVSGKRLGYTPTSTELGKMTKKKATFIFPGGQKYSHTLETHLSPTMLYNVVNIYNPTLVAVGIGVDLLSGAGRTFTDMTLPLIDKDTGNKVYIDIEKIRKRPEHFILASAGVGYGTIERLEEENKVYIAEMNFELIRSHRDIIYYGFGCNPGYFKEKDRAGVRKVALYVLFKVAPRIDNSPRRIYFIGHAGAGNFWSDFDQDEEFSDLYVYFGLGMGMSFSKKVYAELLFNPTWNECVKIPDTTLGFRVGYRFDLF